MKNNYQKNLHAEMHKLVELMIDEMEKTGDNWVKCWSNPSGSPKNFKSQLDYRGFNFLYLNYIMQKREYKTPYFLTFKQAKELGGKIKKGSKSIQIFFYKSFVIEDKEKEKSKNIPMLKQYRIFNIEDIEDIEYQVPKVKTNENKRLDYVDRFINDTNAKIKHGYNVAAYNRKNDNIIMPDIKFFKDSESYYSTLLHELTHWSGSEKRLNRKKGAKFADNDYSFEELIAELGSVFLCNKFNINIEKNQHPEYLKSWISALKANPQILWKAASEAQKAFDYLKEITENKKIERVA